MKNHFRKKPLVVRKVSFASTVFSHCGTLAKKRYLPLIPFIFLSFYLTVRPEQVMAQVTLGTSPYTQNFNSIGTALPTGWSVSGSATSTSLGTGATFNTATTAWTSTTAQFANYASTNAPSTSADGTATQASRTDRALGVKQANASDPGAAFEFEVANTTGLGNFSLTFTLENLDPSVSKSAVWAVDYGFGASPTTFTTVTTSPASPTTGGSVAWGGTTVTVNFGTALNNNSGPVWIRIVNLAGTTGGGSSRPATAIDDFSLSWQSLSTTATSYGPYCVTTTTGSSSFNVPFTSTGTFSSGNVYTAQLSNSSGSFASPTTLGTLTSTANSGNISVTIPAGRTGGSGYRIRVISSSPSLTSADNGSNITINAISGQPSNQTVCAGTAATFSVTASGSPTYQWQESADLSTWANVSNGTVSGVTYSGATTASLTVTGSTPHYYRCVVTYSTCTLTSSSAQLAYNTVPSNPPAPTTPLNPACGSAILTESAAPSGISYYWQGTTSGGTSTTNNASATYTASATGTYYVRAKDNTSGCWSSGSGSLAVTINASPTITTQPTSTSITASASTSLTVATSASGATYQWQYSANGSTWSNVANNTPSGITYSGSTTATLSLTTTSSTSAGSYYYRCVITSSAGCSSTSNTATVAISALSATSTIPVGNGYPCGGSSSNDSIMYFGYDPTTSTITRMSTCKPNLASPGLSAFGTSISFNPADGYLYFTKYTGGNSYIWRWQPGTCPSSSLPVYQTYTGKTILGIDFDQNGYGYQIYFTGSSAPYGIALQQVDFSTGTFGPIENIDLQGYNIYSQNGDLVITPSGQFLMVWDNKYFTLNYTDYNTATPLVATYVDTLSLSGGGYLVGLSYAQGKLVGSSSSGCAYYDFNILTGAVTPLTKGSGVQYSTDMTNITSGVGSAKTLVSATPVSPGVYDLVYDIYVENYGDYPISNLQVTEDLTTIHPTGASAISNVSSEWVDNPAGIVLNSSYNGVTDKNLITTSPTQSLPNFPVANNHFTIRIKFRLSSVQSGVVYYNNAVVSGTGYNNVPLQDSSTNGSNPDLNANNKPDDAGENQSTPFSISVTAESPPCTSINTVLYSENFGTGTGISTTLPGTMTTEYAPGSNPMNEETYVITENANNGNTSKFVDLTDHTGGTNGRMFLVNADVQNYKLFEKTISISCVNLKYSFATYAANAINSAYTSFCSAFGGTQEPKLTFVIRNAADNSIIASSSTSDITDTTWQYYGLKWVMPSGVTSVKLQIYNIGPGGCGNVIALDDIQFGLCDPQPTVSATTSAGCLGSNTSINASLSDTTGMSTNLQYQWQASTDGSSWSNISGATTIPYTINNVTIADQKYYRLVVSSADNGSSCQYISNNIYLTAKDSSSSPSSASSDVSFVCPGQPATLTVHGGSLGNGGVWKWYTSSCGGTFIGNGSSITVYPNVSTTYYVRASGDCNTTQCTNVTVPIACVLASEAIDLKGTIENQQTNLSWSVTSDIRISTMQVERSIDGITYAVIKQITVNGLADRNGYFIKDDVAALNTNRVYYRIKVINDNRGILYSKVLNLPVNANAFNAVVIPNPASSKAKVDFYVPSPTTVLIKLFNARGQLAQHNTIIAEAGYNSYNLPNLDKLAKGIYFISITNATGVSYLKLIIE